MPPKTTKSRARSSAASPPLPGQPVKGSQTGRPIMAALDLFSRRWVLRIIWELRDGPCGFREMRARCDQMSPDTLSTRLSDLKEAGIVDQTEEGLWTLTALGQQLSPVLMSLHAWSEQWAQKVAPAPRGKR